MHFGNDFLAIPLEKRLARRASDLPMDNRRAQRMAAAFANQLLRSSSDARNLSRFPKRVLG
jgi:hypothetical protein